MTELFIVYGPQGSGKSTRSAELSKYHQAIVLSVDDWMKDLFVPDLPETLDFSWVLERVQRVENRIWATANRLLDIGTKVVLDLGFMRQEDRARFQELVTESGHTYSLHYVTADKETRKLRVLGRNKDQGETFSFKVTPQMFEFMESVFEPMTEVEAKLATVIETNHS